MGIVENNRISIVIIDDHPLFRQGVADVLSLEDDFFVAGISSSGVEGLDVIRTVKPDVAIVDVNLPEMNGQAVTQQVLFEKLSTRIILLTAYDDAQQRLHAFRVGASAYCTKDVNPEELIRTIRLVNAGHFLIGGEIYNSAGVKKWLLSQIENMNDIDPTSGDNYEPLSPREMEVLSYVTHGLSNKEIATTLGISHQTVKNHVTSILRKIGVEDRTQAAIYALRRGWVRLFKDMDSTRESV